MIRLAIVIVGAAIMAGCTFLWLGVPVGWLWIGSQVEQGTSLSIAMVAMAVGIVLTALALTAGLASLNRFHIALRRRSNDRIPEHGVLEVMMVASAGIAVVVFGVWFFGFAGASPLPLNLGF